MGRTDASDNADGSSCGDTQASVTNCGSCGNACPTNGPDHSTAVCTHGTCGFQCGAGYILMGGSCAQIGARGCLAPLSTSTATSRRPTLHFQLGAAE